MDTHLFEVHLNCPTHDLKQAEAQLRQAVRPAGHDAWLDESKGRCFLAVRMTSRRPEHELERLMRQANLWGCFVPLRP